MSEFQMTDFLNTYVNLITRPTLGDLFSYKSRTTKRLIRHVVALYEAIRSEVNDAVTAEIWFACVAPVMQGYWSLPVSEKKKKKVLDAFHVPVINIIFNEAILASKEFQELEPSAQEARIEQAHADLGERLRERTNEYTIAMLKFCDRDETNPRPKELIEALTRNLFRENDSRIRNPTHSLAKSPDTLGAWILATVMITAFADSIRG